jgi:CBS domain-containing protein
MNIRDIMSPLPVSVQPDWPVRRVLELLVEHEISGVPVVEGDDRIVGVVSEKDLLALFSQPEPENVAAIMTGDPIAVSVDAPLVDVVDCLMTYDFRRVLVHEKGKLVGLVSRSDLMPVILGLLLEQTEAD